MMPTREELIKEIVVKTSRSGGKGGQNVNKVSTKVEVVFNIPQSILFSDQEKLLLQEKLSNKLDTEGFIHVVAQKERSQLLNKQLAIDKLFNILAQSLVVKKARKPTKIPKAIIEKRLLNKAMTAEKKRNRKDFGF